MVGKRWRECYNVSTMVGLCNKAIKQVGNMVTRVPTDQQDVEYSEYQPMIKIPTDVQNTNRHYPPEKNVQNTKKRSSKFLVFWTLIFELDAYLLCSLHTFHGTQSPLHLPTASKPPLHRCSGTLSLCSPSCAPSLPPPSLKCLKKLKRRWWLLTDILRNGSQQKPKELKNVTLKRKFLTNLSFMTQKTCC